MTEKTKIAVETEAWVAIVEDSLDVVLMLGSILYIAALNETAFTLTPDTMAAIGGTGATLRLILRRLLKRIVEVRLAKRS